VSLGPAIWGGDLVRALARLDALDDPSKRKEILERLGLDLVEQAEPGDEPEPEPEGHHARQPAREPVRTVGITGRMRAATEEEPTPEAAPNLLGVPRLVELPRDTEGPPGWLQAAHPMGPADRPGPHRDPAPIIPPRYARGVLTALAAALADSGEPDVERIIERFVRGEPLDRLPEARLPTLRFGVRLLLDGSRGMDPLATDQLDLREELEHIVPDLEVLAFVGCPSRGLRRLSLDDERPPPSVLGDVTIVLATDLGIGGGPDAAPAGEWAAWARREHREGARLVALVPYREERWPPGLPPCLRCVWWDPRSTAARVAARVRRAR